MLETRALLLGSAALGQPRSIFDAASKKLVGFSRWMRPPGWRYRLLGPILSVHETEDEPLLFQVYPYWWRWPLREVRDAEEERVGYVRREAIKDRNNHLYARTRHAEDWLIYQCVNGDELAAIRHTSAGLELAYRNLIDADPFAKMLLLAAALLQE